MKFIKEFIVLFSFTIHAFYKAYEYSSKIVKTNPRISIATQMNGANLDSTNEWQSREKKVVKLRNMLNNVNGKNDSVIIMPCCYDGLTAKLIENAGFDLTFMTGFGVSATYGQPDAGLLSVGEMLQSGATICNVLKSIPCIGDADTGYGNEMNVKRTVKQYAQMGFAGLMIEDQVSPKRCGHVTGKQVISREDAVARIKAAVAARDEGDDILILARTDARGPLGLEEAIQRCILFRQLGADWTFLEAPQSIDEMKQYCSRVDGPKLANMLEYGSTPILSPVELKQIGYTVAAYPLTLLSAGIKIMQEILRLLKEGKPVTGDLILDFKELKKVVGFDEYNEDMMKLMNEKK